MRHFYGLIIFQSCQSFSTREMNQRVCKKILQIGCSYKNKKYPADCQYKETTYKLHTLQFFFPNNRYEISLMRLQLESEQELLSRMSERLVWRNFGQNVRQNFEGNSCRVSIHKKCLKYHCVWQIRLLFNTVHYSLQNHLATEKSYF